MSDQIIDLCESLQPGPRGGVGPRGEQGLAGVNAVPADEAVADWIGKQSKTRTALDALYADQRDTIVVFGDSMTQAPDIDGTRYPERLAAKLGLKLRSYGHGGSGFVNVSSGVSYKEEIDQAEKDGTVDRAKVRYVLINGSTNDFYVAPDELESKVESLTKRIVALYPHSEIYGLTGLFFNNVRYLVNGVEQKYRLQDCTKTFRATMAGFRAAGIRTIDSYRWFAYTTGLDKGDHLHPNADGTELLASTLHAILTRGVTVRNVPLLEQHVSKELFPAGAAKDDLKNLFASYNVWYSNVLVDDSTFHHAVYVDIGMDHSQLLRFAARKSGGSEPTHVWSASFPAFVKPLPYRQTANAARTLLPCLTTIGGNRCVNAFLDPYVVSNGRLDTPNDAAKYVWITFDFVQDPADLSNDGTVRMFDLLRNVSKDDPTRKCVFSLQCDVTLPLDATYI